MGLFSRTSKYPPAPKPKDYEKMVCPWEKDIPNMVPDVKPGDSKWSFIKPDLNIDRLHYLAHDGERDKAKLSREQIYELYYQGLNLDDPNDEFRGLVFMMKEITELFPREGHNFVVRHKDGTYHDFKGVNLGFINWNRDNNSFLSGFYLDKTTNECVVVNNFPDPQKSVLFLENIPTMPDTEYAKYIHDTLENMDIFHSDLPASCNLSPVYDYKACYRDYMDKKNAIYKSTGMIPVKYYEPDIDKYAKFDTEPVENAIQSWELSTLYENAIRPQMEWYTREHNYDRDRAEYDAYLKRREETEEKFFGKEPEGYAECLNVAWQENMGFSYPMDEETKKKYDYHGCVKRSNDMSAYYNEINNRCMAFKASGVIPSLKGEAAAVSGFEESQHRFYSENPKLNKELQKRIEDRVRRENAEAEKMEAALQAKLDKERQERERQQAPAQAVSEQVSPSQTSPSQAVPSYAQIAQMPPEEQRRYTKHLFEEMPPKELAEEFARCNEENRKILMDLKTAYDKDKERREQEQKFAEAMGFGNYWKELNKDK